MSKSSPDRLLLNVEQVAEALGVGRSSVYQMIGREEIPSILIGRARRVPRAWLETFVERRTNEWEGEQKKKSH